MLHKEKMFSKEFEAKDENKHKTEHKVLKRSQQDEGLSVEE